MRNFVTPLFNILSKRFIEHALKIENINIPASTAASKSKMASSLYLSSYFTNCPCSS